MKPGLHASRDLPRSCELPNPNLYRFEGAVVSRDGGSDQTPLTADNLLLRGCTLRKTDWVVRSGAGGEGWRRLRGFWWGVAARS
jgi:hypothetical protein